MVGDLEDVGPQQLGPGQQGLLRGQLDVPAEQQHGAGGLDAQHHARVVRRRPLPVDEPGRPQHPPAQRAHHALLVEGGGRQRDTGRGRPPPHPRRLVVGLGQRGHLHRADGPAPQHAGQPLDVVGVEVREHHEGHPADAEVAQTAVDRVRVGPGIDDHRGRRAGGQHHGVPLTDVADDRDPTRRRPPGPHPERRGGHEQHDQDTRGPTAVPAQRRER